MAPTAVGPRRLTSSAVKAPGPHPTSRTRCPSMTAANSCERGRERRGIPAHVSVVSVGTDREAHGAETTPRRQPVGRSRPSARIPRPARDRCVTLRSLAGRRSSRRPPLLVAPGPALAPPGGPVRLGHRGRIRRLVPCSWSSRHRSRSGLGSSRVRSQAASRAARLGLCDLRDDRRRARDRVASVRSRQRLTGCGGRGTEPTTSTLRRSIRRRVLCGRMLGPSTTYSCAVCSGRSDYRTLRSLEPGVIPWSTM